MHKHGWLQFVHIFNFVFPLRDPVLDLQFFWKFACFGLNPKQKENILKTVISQEHFSLAYLPKCFLLTTIFLAFN